MEIIKKGKYYKIFSMYMVGTKLYFVSKIDYNNLISCDDCWSFLSKKQAFDIFEKAEKSAETPRIIDAIENWED